MTRGKRLSCPPVVLLESNENLGNHPCENTWENVGQVLANILAKTIKESEMLSVNVDKKNGQNVS
jgi:hypothetical protein